VWHPDGSIQIQDRAKDIIISGMSFRVSRQLPLFDLRDVTNSKLSGGENISSVALESMLVEHPAILEAGVVAVPDSHWGERPKAYLTVKQANSSSGGNPSLRPQDVIDWAKHQSAISKFMVPREVEIVRELPKTSTGKIKKNVLREWAKKGTPKEVLLVGE
jgi:acyl-CoA synthetase (AMP-forming)/AMP-acid ligase II